MYLRGIKDAKIISLIQSGEQKVFHHLYGHLGKIDAYIIKNSGTSHDAKDIFQQALLVFYKNCLKPDFELTSSVGTYLFSVSKNLWLKELRNKKKRVVSNLPDYAYEEEGDEIEKEVLIEKMLFTLDKLTANCRKLIRLYHFQKMHWADIVQIMGYKNEHTARNQKYKCLKKLKSLLS